MLGSLINEALVINSDSSLRTYKVLRVEFQKKERSRWSNSKKKSVSDEAPYFSEAVGFSLPNLLVNQAVH